MAINWILEKISWDYNEKQLKKVRPLVDQINMLCDEWDSLSDDDIKAKTQEFKERLVAWETVDDLMVEAFATVKQACKRMVGTTVEVKGEKIERVMVPYDVQLIWGIVLHKWMNAEMRTWEWKTLVATLPAYLNALEWKWVHVVTVNDYLASRDAEWMSHLYEWLGLTTGAVVKSVALDKRKEAYDKDITYVENSELGFDYLRDNLAKSVDDRNLLWRPLHYAIIDEVDSILIDEARTPLIISQPSDVPTEKYVQYAKLIQFLVPSKTKKKVKQWFLKELLSDVKNGKEDEVEDDGGDYYIEEKSKSVTLSSHGIAKLEKILKVENIYKDLGYDEIHHIENALRANAVYHKDKEYLVSNGEVLIVDENTGRAMPWRRYSEWLHQAIEAKEWLTIQRESRTLASITYQHFFKQYNKLSGMTGTAATEAEEFEKIYDLEVVIIPTNKPILRVDKNDAVYFNQDAKWKAVVDHIKFYHTAGVPILIGTSSIHTSELVSSILKKMTFQHTVLNAKYHEQEATIVKNAWAKGSIVVATNMAWRGTDIKLSKELNPSVAVKYAQYAKKLAAKAQWFSGTVYSSEEYEWMMDSLREVFGFSDDVLDQATKAWIKNDDCMMKITINTAKKNKEQAFAEIVVKPTDGNEENREERDLHFGLFILGTEKHDSRRIDNQLRGRAWRQGDAGVSQFFVAMDDEIMRKMWGDKIQSVARLMLSAEQLETMAFTQKQFSKSTERSQKQMEGRHYGIRKHLFDYDSVINKQRTRIYAKRDTILGIWVDTEEKADAELVELTVLDEIKHFIDEVVDDLVAWYATATPWNLAELLETLSWLTGGSFLEEDYASVNSSNKLATMLKTQLHEMFDTKVDWVDDEKLQEYCKRVYLHVIDRNWMLHITDMQYLREKVGLYGYAQLDPLVIYKKESYGKFQTLLATMRKETLAQVMRTDFSAAQAQPTVQAQPKKVNMADILKAVTQWLKVKKAPAKQVAETKAKATDTWSDDDVEVIEVSDDEDTSGVDLSAMKQKLRPNDKVSVRYPDGRVENDVKWKKVKSIVEWGEAEVV